MVIDRTFSRNAFVVGIGKFRLFSGRTPDGNFTLRVTFTHDVVWNWADKQLDTMWQAWGERQSYAVLSSYCRKWEMDANRWPKHSGLRHELLSRVNALQKVMERKLNSMSIVPMGA